mmetsp:Transcript_10231/g.22631  ORF Transcript_10231/g.22631 Transcript_10231/m.22631 type:complete len:393 (-) Transcript_10231:7-1185(-)
MATDCRRGAHRGRRGDHSGLRLGILSGRDAIGRTGLLWHGVGRLGGAVLGSRSVHCLATLIGSGRQEGSLVGLGGDGRDGGGGIVRGELAQLGIGLGEVGARRTQSLNLHLVSLLHSLPHVALLHLHLVALLLHLLHHLLLSVLQGEAGGLLLELRLLVEGSLVQLHDLFMCLLIETHLLLHKLLFNLDGVHHLLLLGLLLEDRLRLHRLLLDSPLPGLQLSLQGASVSLLLLFDRLGSWQSLRQTAGRLRSRRLDAVGAGRGHGVIAAVAGNRSCRLLPGGRSSHVASGLSVLRHSSSLVVKGVRPGSASLNHLRGLDGCRVSGARRIHSAALSHGEGLAGTGGAVSGVGGSGHGHDDVLMMMEEKVQEDDEAIERASQRTKLTSDEQKGA